MTEEEEIEAKRKPSMRVFTKLWPYVRPYWKIALIPAILELIFGLVVTVQPWLLKWALDYIITPSLQVAREAVAHPEIMPPTCEWWVFKGMPVWAVNGILWLSVLMVCATLAQSFISACQRTYIWQSSRIVINNMRESLFNHLQTLSMNYFDNERQGRIITRVDRDVEILKRLVSQLPMEQVYRTMMIVYSCMFIAIMNINLLLIALSLFPIIITISLWIKNWGIPIYRRQRATSSKLTSNLCENISGVQVVQAFAREDKNLLNFRAILDQFRKDIMAGAFMRGVCFHAMYIAFGIVEICAIWFVSTHIVNYGDMTVGDLFSISIYMGMMLWPLFSIVFAYDELLTAFAAAERVVDLFERQPAVMDKPGAAIMPPMQGEVEFRDVFFHYDVKDKKEEWILKNINFNAKSGETIALVGSTGSGKTSMINLIVRFYDPQLGAVMIDGRNIKDVTQKSLHQQMALVLQQNFLFAGTVMDNLKYGRPETTEEEAIAAAKALGSHELIMALAKGYETDVRERGGGISHGERQLICFTRALIANPKILLLDEATSAVDTHTELIIQTALQKLMEGRTTFVVAHRLSTIRHATKILVVKNGEIVESGSHTELLAKRGEYASMHEKFICSPTTLSADAANSQN